MSVSSLFFLLLPLPAHIIERMAQTTQDGIAKAGAIEFAHYATTVAKGSMELINDASKTISDCLSYPVSPSAPSCGSPLAGIHLSSF